MATVARGRPEVHQAVSIPEAAGKQLLVGFVGASRLGDDQPWQVGHVIVRLAEDFGNGIVGVTLPTTATALAEAPMATAKRSKARAAA